MPDSADNGRPSSAPLSVEDADRLADSFHAFWDDEPAAAPAEASATPAPVAAPTPHPVTVTAPMPAVAPAPHPVTATAPMPVAVQSPQPFKVTAPMPVAVPTPHPATVTAPMPAVEPVTRAKPLGKQTLIGIAPITIENPRSSESEKPPASVSQKPPASVSEKPPPSQPIQSSPEVPGYAIAYTPKDPPSTPAVVIAPEAQSSPENPPPENRRPFSQTMPSRVRSSPNASVAPPPTPAALDDFNPYAPQKGKGARVALIAGGALLVLVAALGVHSLSGSNHPSASVLPGAQTKTDIVRAATVGAALPTPEPAEAAAAATTASQTPTRAAAAEREPAATPPRPTSERAPTKSKVKAKGESAAATPRPVTRAPTSESSPPASKPAGKGVIVRDAPF